MKSPPPGKRQLPRTRENRIVKSLRMTPDEYKSAREQARADGKCFSEWIRKLIDRAKDNS